MDWTRGVVAGAVIGGVGWGLLAADAVGAVGDGLNPDRIDGSHLPVAVGVSMVCLVIAGVLPRVGGWRTATVALVVAPASGWVVVGLLYLQAVGTMATWR